MNAADPIHLVLDQLKDVKQTASGYEARCPAHEDQTPSLSVSTGDDGRVLLHCHAGCTVDSICKAMSINVRDLFPVGLVVAKKKCRKVRGQIVEVYDYCDADGTLLFQTVRFEPKAFRQRRLDGDGKWVWNLKGVKRVLFRLRELLSADPEVWIFIVEGEKDVESLRALGFVATTNPMGAGKWRLLGDDSALKNRVVVIICDKDDPGRKHGNDVAARLLGCAKEIRILELPGEGKDASDWIAGGGMREELLALAAAAPVFKAEASVEEDQEEQRQDAKRKSQASALVELASKVYLFHDDDVAYAAINLAQGGKECLAVRGKSFRRYLARQFHQSNKTAPSSQAVADALTVIEGKALFEGLEHKVYVRLAYHDGVIYLDLADRQRRIARITTQGWNLVQDAPIYFRRPKGVLEIPAPARGGSLTEIRSFINVADDRQFILLVAWLVSAMRPGRPVPPLALNSEQGSGKSTATRLLRMLIDPNLAMIRCTPREPRDLMIAASNGLVVALENLSHIPDWLSDALCRLSTGGGFGTRTLYENEEETLFDALRPVILNGIEELGTRSDLLERTIRVQLPTISESMRLTERELYARFELARPGLLGALLDAVSMGLGRIDNVVLSDKPRMADFAEWVVAAEPALPWEPGAFMRAYAENRDSAHALAVDASVVGDAIIAFAEAKGKWIGKASHLLKELNAAVDDQTRSQQGWPKRPHLLSGALRRLSPDLRALGVEVKFPDRTRKGRSLIIRKVAQNSVTSVTERHNPDSDPAKADGRDAHVTHRDAPVTLGHDAGSPAVTQRDAGDAQKHALSGAVCDTSIAASGGESSVLDGALREVSEL